jgi:hypothetical protein
VLTARAGAAGKFLGNYARPRRFELAGAINRLRSIAFRQAR